MIYGPHTTAVQSIIDRISTLTDGEIQLLDTAWEGNLNVARDAAWYAAGTADWYGAWSADWDAVWSAATGTAPGGAWSADWNGVTYASWGAVWDATLASLTYDLATENGSYTTAERDLLLAPWVSVCGMPEGLV